ncbi:MAG TPA: hypothetical protein VK961_13535 [Chthoniobacter sp.]|nr:hypothetical protein [Chthoniobacter sp.]
MSSAVVCAEEAGPEVSYQWRAGLSQIVESKVQVGATGQVQVIVRYQRRAPVEYATQLSAEEIAALGLAVRAAGFFAIKAEPNRPEPTDVGITDLTIAYGDQRRSMTYAWLPELRPVEELMQKLVTQAGLDGAAAGTEMSYELLGGLNPRMASGKVLQPYVFKPKIVASLSKQKEFAALSCRLQALTALTTPAEFSGILAQAFPKRLSPEWRFWLTTLCTPECYNNLGEEHLRAVFPVMLREMREYGAPPPMDRDHPEAEAFRRYRSIFREHHFDAGLPD